MAAEEGEVVVELQNAYTRIAFEIIEESLIASVKVNDQFVNVEDWAAAEDMQAYKTWEEQRRQAVEGLSREEYFKAYLLYLKILTEKYFGNLLQSGAAPHSAAYDDMMQKRKVAQEKFSRAWKAMQGLDYEHPIRQKYIHGDPAWVDDMIRVLDGH